MAFTFYTVGLLEDFSYYSNCVQNRNSAYARLSPYYVVELQNGSNYVLRYDFPQAVSEVYLSEITYISATNGNYASNRLLALRKSDLTTDLLCFAIDHTTRVVTVYANNIARGTFQMIVGVQTQIEVRFKRDAIAGVVQVWKNGELVVDFTGDTGSSTDLIACAYWCSYSGYSLPQYISDLVITTTGRIANKRPVILPLTGPGDSNPPKYYDFVGNQFSTGGSGLTVNRTYIQKQAFQYAGTLTSVTANFSTVGTCYIGICTRNAATPTKHTRRLVSSQLTVGATGIKTFVAGTDFPADWVIAPGECLAIFCETAQVKSVSALADDNKYNSDASYYYAGNGLAGTSELSYIAGVSNTFDLICAQYQVTNSGNFYNTSSAVDKLSKKDFVETQRYAEFSNADEAVFCSIGDLPLVCTGVKSIKVSARSIAGSALLNSEWRLKIGTDDLAVLSAAPTNMTLKTIQFDGTWTPEQCNSAQIGYKVKP